MAAVLADVELVTRGVTVTVLEAVAKAVLRTMEMGAEEVLGSTVLSSVAPPGVVVPGFVSDLAAVGLRGCATAWQGPKMDEIGIADPRASPHAAQRDLKVGVLAVKAGEGIPVLLLTDKLMLSCSGCVPVMSPGLAMVEACSLSALEPAMGVVGMKASFTWVALVWGMAVVTRLKSEASLGRCEYPDHLENSKPWSSLMELCFPSPGPQSQEGSCRDAQPCSAHSESSHREPQLEQLKHEDQRPLASPGSIMHSQKMPPNKVSCSAMKLRHRIDQ
ncbi:hypothetical protein DV515_00004798 [Chloebia gouldiae]|uniref:Uncharacterized protein n=1 Tax=Chloebia gouldiae TaxID=44316 RepID=A0A3L8SQ58_CHLGU|nr:hypothetical protein DV515_00004798 [Chloebia gouldiae]